jgi:outer membrane protein
VRGERARSDAALAAVDEAAQTAIARTVRAYLAVLGDRGVLDAHDRRLAALDSELDRVRLRRDAGKAADVEVLRVEATLAAARAERVRAAADLDVAERELARLADLPPDGARAERLVVVEAEAEPVHAREVLLARALATNPVLERARREQAAAHAGRAVATAARWPTLDLIGAYMDRGGLDTEHQLEWNVGVQLSYPLFTGGAVAGAAERAGAESRAAAQRVRAVEQQVARDVDRALAAVEETAARVASLETAVTRFAEVARIEQLRLDAGSGTQTDYLNAEADLLAARAAMVEATHGAIAARVDLARVIGALDLVWVEDIGETP